MMDLNMRKDLGATSAMVLTLRRDTAGSLGHALSVARRITELQTVPNVEMDDTASIVVCQHLRIRLPLQCFNPVQLLRSQLTG